MSTIRTPVGPQPKKVYWRRRLLVLLGVLVVILIVVLLIARPGRSHAPAAGTHSPAPTHSTAVAIGTCNPAALDIEPVTDALTYAPGIDPKISLTITDNGAAPCNFDVGTNVQVYKITSGSETIWSSTDCQKGATPLSKLLEPGKPLSTTPFAWDRTRSSTTTCDVKNKKQVVAGGASYHLVVSVNGVVSKKSLQFVLAK
jgi:hypothetical protein